ncbi:MAG TPA: hypothetical protein VGC42_29970 [Kofleriaceae bacterium]
MTSPRKLALQLALAASGVLLVMVAVGLVTGASQEAHEWYTAPDGYAARLLAQAGPLRVVFGLDIAFLVLYTAFFAALADYLRRLGRPFVAIALGAMLLTALLDIVEDHHILALLGVAEAGRPIDDGALVAQQVISSTKFSVSYLALVLFGLAVPRDTRLGWVLAIFLVGGTLVSGVLGFAAPPAWRASLDAGRWIGFLAGFLLAAAWLRALPDSMSASNT